MPLLPLVSLLNKLFNNRLVPTWSVPTQVLALPVPLLHLLLPILLERVPPWVVPQVLPWVVPLLFRQA